MNVKNYVHKYINKLLMILVVNCYVDGNRINKLLDCLKKNDVKHVVIDNKENCFNWYRKISSQTDKLNGIIISGSEMFFTKKMSGLQNYVGCISGYFLHLKLGIPLLGICFGSQLITVLNKGELDSFSNHKDMVCKASKSTSDNECPIFRDMDQKFDVAISMTDYTSALPEGFDLVFTGLVSKKHNQVPLAFWRKDTNTFGCSFHPESLETTWLVIRNFVAGVCKEQVLKEKVFKTPPKVKVVKVVKVVKEVKQIVKKAPTAAPFVTMKSHIVNGLKLLKNEEQKNKAWFKVKAYNTAIQAVEKYTGDIGGVDDVKNIEGLSDKMREKVVGMLSNSDTIANIKGQEENMKAYDELSKVMAIGDVKARDLIEKHGIKSFEDLKERGMDLLNDKQKMGVKYYHDFNERIPRKEMDKHFEQLKSTFSKFANLKFEVVGSYRRGAASSGDIDVLVTSKSDVSDEENSRALDGIVAALKGDKYLIDDFAFGKEKYLGVCKLKRHKSARRIDILYIPKDKFAFALLYFTGSQSFNIRMRNIALEQGLSLSEHGLKYTTGDKKGEFVSGVFEEEKDVFKHLDMEYVAPVDRA